MNKNCLEGRRCPKCGHEDEVLLDVTTWACLPDAGINPYGNSLRNWDVGDDGAFAKCPECQYVGTFGEWRKEEA